MDATLSLLCRAGSLLCAIPLEHVAEIMRPMPVTALTGIPPFVYGVAVVRGAPIPVLGLGLLIAGVENEAPTRFVRMRMGPPGQERDVALAVSAVLGVRPISSYELKGMPPLLRDSRSELLVLLGALDRELLAILSSGYVLPEGVVLSLSEARGAAQ